MLIDGTWRDSWCAIELLGAVGERLEEGQRGGGAAAGRPGMAAFIGVGEYPACSEHGAMNRLGRDSQIWRCLVEGCNVGLELYRSPGRL